MALLLKFGGVADWRLSVSRRSFRQLESCSSAIKLPRSPGKWRASPLAEPIVARCGSRFVNANRPVIPRIAADGVENVGSAATRVAQEYVPDHSEGEAPSRKPEGTGPRRGIPPPNVSRADHRAVERRIDALRLAYRPTTSSQAPAQPRRAFGGRLASVAGLVGHHQCTSHLSGVWR